jgi:DNA-binding transcriptional ArsR family regulator
MTRIRLETESQKAHVKLVSTVEALCATLISIVPMTIEVESEDGKALATFSTDDLILPKIDEVDRQIMESLARGVRTLGLLSERLGISKATVRSRLRKLERRGWKSSPREGRKNRGRSHRARPDLLGNPVGTASQLASSNMDS